MEKVFIQDLDATLDLLYESQVSLEKHTLEQYRHRDNPEAGPATLPHYYCVDQGILIANIIATDGRYPEHPFVFRFIEEQLIQDGLVYRHTFREHDVDFIHFHISAKGKLFKESGGYHRSSRRQWWDGAKTMATTILTAINAIVIIWLTWRAAQSADEDKLKDDQIIQLTNDKAAMENRIHALEQAWRDQAFLNITHQGDTLQ